MNPHLVSARWFRGPLLVRSFQDRHPASGFVGFDFVRLLAAPHENVKSPQCKLIDPGFESRGFLGKPHHLALQHSAHDTLEEENESDGLAGAEILDGTPS